MKQIKLFSGETAHVATVEFHRDRQRVKHLEQPYDRERLQCAALLILAAQRHLGRQATVSDLGCGDGGLLSLIQGHVEDCWGYDFTPANAAGWTERRVRAEQLDVFGADRDSVKFGDITATTEVLEHLTDPFAAVRWIGRHSHYLVASSPWDETEGNHNDCHAWAFDREGYRALIEHGGFAILKHLVLGRFQLILGGR